MHLVSVLVAIAVMVMALAVMGSAFAAYATRIVHALKGDVFAAEKSVHVLKFPRKPGHFVRSEVKVREAPPLALAA